MDKKKSRVVAAVITKDGKYLCMQRCKTEKYAYITERWEFPGGKVEDGESDHEALLREIKEEMDWDVYVGRPLVTVTHEYPDFIVELHAYSCKGGEGEFKMLEHLDCKWLPLEELPSLNWTEADREVVIQLQKA